MAHVWHDFLYTPLLNFLIFLYDGPAYGNLGVAVIELTVALRLVLLPFTLLEERNRYRFEQLNKRIEAIERDFKTDHVRRDEKIRELLKSQKVSYWSKVLVLGVQALVLVLLYQAFLGGIRFTHEESLYSWVSMPFQINTNFLGFDIAERRTLFWPSVVAVLLFLQIYTEQKQREHLIKRSDVMYLFLFPIFTFVALFILPMVKSLFILTSMLFSMTIFALRKLLFRTSAPPPAPLAH